MINEYLPVQYVTGLMNLIFKINFTYIVQYYIGINSKL